MRLQACFVLAASLLGFGCPPSGGPTFKESVKEAYRPCNSEFLKARAGQHAMQLVFRPCGSNNFQNFSWNPEGITLYYRSLQGPWVLKDTGENLPLRLGMPKAPPAWFNRSMLAVPDSTGRKMSVYNIDSHILNLLELDQHDPEQLSRGQGQDEILYLAAETPGGIKYAWRLSANTGETERAFDWMDTGLETMTYNARVDVVCYREYADDVVICAKGSDGKELRRVKDRLRGTISVDGRYLVTEGLGAEVSVFKDQAAADALNLPEGVNTMVRPPTLHVTDMDSGEELLWEGVHGTQFQWYEASPYYASFLLWGFDNEQTNANVTLVDLRHFLKAKGWTPPLAVDGRPVEEVAAEGAAATSAVSGTGGAAPSEASTPPASTP